MRNMISNYTSSAGRVSRHGASASHGCRNGLKISWRRHTYPINHCNGIRRQSLWIGKHQSKDGHWIFMYAQTTKRWDFESIKESPLWNKLYFWCYITLARFPSIVPRNLRTLLLRTAARYLVGLQTSSKRLFVASNLCFWVLCITLTMMLLACCNMQTPADYRSLSASARTVTRGDALDGFARLPPEN